MTSDYDASTCRSVIYAATSLFYLAVSVRQNSWRNTHVRRVYLRAVASEGAAGLFTSRAPVALRPRRGDSLTARLITPARTQAPPTPAGSTQLNKSVPRKYIFHLLIQAEHGKGYNKTPRSRAHVGGRRPGNVWYERGDWFGPAAYNITNLPSHYTLSVA